MKILFLFLCGMIPVPGFSDIRLPRLVSDGMVLQREVTLEIRGWASPGEKVSLSFRNKTYRVVTDGEGKWKITLPPQQSGGPRKMIFKGQNLIEINDILFGDVWICSGQSNMVLPMERVKEKYPEEIQNADYSEIRHFFIPPTANLQQPAGDLPPGSWKQANSRDVLNFSAVAYFFAKTVYEKTHIPIGLVNASVGGTPIEAWISEEGLKEFPDMLKTVAKNREPDNPLSVRSREPDNPLSGPRDKGLSGPLKWYDPAYIPENWKPFTLPGYWEDQGIRELNGVVWFRKEIDMPEGMTGVPARLFMGRIVDADFMYVNGQQVGNITYQYPPRRYVIPAGVLKPGKNIFVARVINNSGKGGFVPDKPYTLEANGQTIDLRGEWQYRVGEVYAPAPFFPPFNPQYQPTVLYNGMVAPITGYKAKGFLWYQGESNTGNPGLYRKLLPALISDWRKKWNQGDLPFLFVQLANFMEVDVLPAESQWAELRDAQLSALHVPRTAMAVAIDLGEWNDIHPLNKKDVGERLALAAFRLAYGDPSVVHSGPLYKSSRIAGDSIILSFGQVGGGLIARGGEPLNRFEIAGADQRFVQADAVIRDNKVIVRSAKVIHPEQVRYAWADNPEGANLYNAEGLPASPFRTFNPDSADVRPWRGKTCAVVLTYDDGLHVHLDHAIALLDSLGLRGTFYIPGNSMPFQQRIPEWKRAAARGHELGNHTLFHPCDGTQPGRSWVNPEYDLSKYSVERIMDEIRVTNQILSGVDGKRIRSFAYTCGDRKAGDTPFTGQVMEEFPVARGVWSTMNDILTADLSNVGSFMINGESGEKMITLVNKAMESHALLVFMFHGVGGEHDLNVSLEAHRELLQFLKQNEEKIWVTTMLEAGMHIKAYRQLL